MHEIYLEETALKTILPFVHEADIQGAFLQRRGEQEPVVYNLLKDHEDQEDSHYFTLYRGEVKAGFAVVLPHSEAGALSIGPVYVSKCHRGDGLGKPAVEALIAWAIDSDVRKLISQTWESNLQSRQILEHFRFKPVDRIQNDRVNGESTIVYELDLNL